MKIGKFVLVLGSASAFVFAVACSSSSGDDSAAPTDGGGGGDSTTNPTDSGGPVDSGGPTCPGKLADGTYTIHNTATNDGGPTCPPADSQETFPTPVPDAGDAAVVDSGPNPCTTAIDLAACSETVTCDVPDEFHQVTTINLAADGLSATGTTTSKIELPDGGTFSECDYTFTVTKN